MKTYTGMITKSTGSWYDVRIGDSHVLKAKLRGKFKTLNLKVTNPIAVGDIVEVEKETSGEQVAYITHIHPRKNYIIRKSVHKTCHGHLIAANIDQSALIVTLAWPRTSTGFIDRFLVSCEAFRIPAILIFNKCDLYDDQMKQLVLSLRNIYQNLGYICAETSTINKLGIENLRKILKNKLTLFSGHSGVGKSSLLNLLSPELGLRTADLSTFVEKGVHTTTFAEMFQLDENTFIIDTPGIKELGLFEIEEHELSHYFPEMRALLGQCKFHNCLHANEPLCIVKAKVKSGEIAESRYLSYLSMLENEDNRK